MEATHEREIGTVLSTVFYPPEDVERLRSIFGSADFVHCHPGDSEGIARALEVADVAVLWGDLDDRHLAAPRLRWVHCDHAGLTRSARPEVFEKGLLVTGSAGRSAPALAQHAFYFALSLTFDSKSLLEKQASHSWQRPEGYEDRLALYGKTLGVIGFGKTGREMALLGKAFGMRVMAYRRRADEDAPSVDVMLSADAGDTLEPLLDEADVVMLAAHLSDETYHLLSREQFARMKSTAYVINLARGGLLDQDALVEALHAGSIAGAGLDVTDPEPLPSESPLWEAPNVLITPHTTPRLPDRTGRSLQVIEENVRRYREGEPLLNQLTPRDVYTRT